MTEDGTSTTGKECRHLALMRRRQRANLINTPVYRLEPALLQVKINPVPRDPHPQQLSPRDHPVLPGSEHLDLCVGGKSWDNTVSRGVGALTACGSGHIRAA
jgi:hypothetical protein